MKNGYWIKIGRFVTLGGLTPLITALSGCASFGLDQVNPGDPEYAPVPAQSLTPPPNMNGSLYQSNYTMSLYGDQKARRIGDIITVMLEEQTSASQSNDATLQKDADLEIIPTSVLGGAGPGILNNSLTSSRSFTGSGAADRSNSLQGEITVTISDILPNGILEVRGEKWLTLSDGDEYIRVRGLIRPQDIEPNNTIPSNKIADARISFGGKGSLSEAGKAGWLTKFFNSSWWPF